MIIIIISISSSSSSSSSRSSSSSSMYLLESKVRVVRTGAPWADGNSIV